ncbi:MAG: serine phosphatase [Acidobacteriales bacterium]|nr:serine phosphatase [Terriglobales bacterium]
MSSVVKTGAAKTSGIHPATELGSSGVEHFLLRLADPINTSLDLDTLLQTVAELVRQVIPFEIFAILLLNERTQDLRMRFQIGHAPDVERLRIKVGKGITGRAVERRETVLVSDVTRDSDYIDAHPDVKSELAVPLVAKNRVIGVIDIQSSQLDYFKEEHSRLLTLVASRIATAIENARLYTRVARQAQTLQVLNEISRDLTSILNLDQLLKRIGDLLNRVIDFQMFSILLLDQTGQILQHRFSLRFKENIQLKHDIPMGRGLVGAAASEKRTILVPDVTKDSRYIMVNPETRSELCVPLIYKDIVIGVLDLEHTRRGYFNEDNMRTVVTLAAQVAIAIENARLYERIAREEQRMERELSMARVVQQHLLPPCCPVMPSAELAAKFTPAHAIGGDMYDFLTYTGGRVGIAVGDVSGKGAPAALFAALVGGMVRSMTSLEPSPAEMLASINLSLNERRIDAQFVSMLYSVWDEDRKMMQIANSGQPRPIYCHQGKTQIVEATGLPLGLFEDAEYDEVTLNAHPGDVFVFFSDGIIDAVNHKDHQFGRGRVEEIVRKNCDKSADDLVTAIFAAVDEHSAGVSPFDDETVVVVKIKENGAPASATSTSKRSKTSRALRNV